MQFISSVIIFSLEYYANVNSLTDRLTQNRGFLRESGNLWNIFIVKTEEGAIPFYWVEARGAAKHPTMHRAAPQSTIQSKMPVKLRLTNPALKGLEKILMGLGCFEVFLAMGP